VPGTNCHGPRLEFKLRSVGDSRAGGRRWVGPVRYSCHDRRRRIAPSLGSWALSQESLDSLGPIFGELREAGRELLEQRRLCYEEQADSHAEIADNLTKSASMWEQHESEDARKFERISDDSQ
jgi:hypothetical protein